MVEHLVYTENVGSSSLSPPTRRLSMEIFDNKDFKNAFWYWFDHKITEKERKMFKDYPADMAELYFYNQVYCKILGIKN